MPCCVAGVQASGGCAAVSAVLPWAQLQELILTTMVWEQNTSAPDETLLDGLCWSLGLWELGSKLHISGLLS